MSSTQSTYIIVGGGTAGANAVDGIRSRDPDGSIALFGSERHLPYDRPPLSKGLWLGKSTVEQLPVHDERFYTSNGVELHLGLTIEKVRPGDHEVVDAQGRSYRYEKLLLATGGHPRPLQFGEGIVTYLRTLDDYYRLVKASDASAHVIVLGGGFIGCEISASLTQKGNRVTMIFPEEHLLSRMLPADLAGYVTDYYRAKGVSMTPGDTPVSVVRNSGSVSVSTRMRKNLHGDAVLAAIGLALDSTIAAAAGLSVGNGIVVNDRLRTSNPSIYAAGDVAQFPSPALGRDVRIEHWDNARAQGFAAGANMAGADAPFTYLPYFYSDLFDLGFEAVGDINSRLETFADWREKFREGVVYYLDGGVVKGVLLWNVWEKVPQARALVEQKTAVTHPSDLAGKI